ncbi:MarR family winged helix-turn-helix transcriptional regulator [Pseudodonghicola sp.]|uniref:MarR family winged helix-turn-helix transcriptional regulator n=1 Tax=Pseudodonghicola sp. TaxID=1969463 RepID=UPI003A97716B
MSGPDEDESFRTSLLYWVGAFEQLANQQFLRETGGGKSAVSIWRTLSVLSEMNGLTISELSRQTRIERTALSHLLTQMEQQRLIERRPRAGDRRTIEVHLRQAGQDTFQRMRPIRRAVLNRATEGFTPDELDGLMTMLLRLVDNLRTADTGG